MAKLSSFNREGLAVGFEEKFWSVKHPNYPSEAVEDSEPKDKKVSSTENILAAACVVFGTEIGKEEDIWIRKGVLIRVENLPSTPGKKKYAKIVTLEIEQEVWNGGEWRFAK